MSSSRENSIAEEASGLSVFPGAAVFFVGFVMFSMVRLGVGRDMPLGRLLYQLAAVFFVTAAAFLAAALTAKARERGPLERQVFVRRGAKPLSFPLEKLRASYDRIWPMLVNTDWRGAWLPIVAAAAPALLALFALSKAWSITGPGARIHPAQFCVCLYSARSDPDAAKPCR
ncbi:MAG TPA: hypothetical protein VHW69_13025 [Rhizomicrobium sp.]|nr:hypothetical protein [Rhizomicrobium sp.]